MAKDSNTISSVFENVSRREFIKRSSMLSAVMAGGGSLGLSLAAMGEAAAAEADDYKAIVCIYLSGGNDHANTLVPFDISTWNQYYSLRSNLAYSRTDLEPTVLNPELPLPNSVQYALAPELNPLLQVFDSGALVPILNIGTLVQPVNKTQYLQKSVRLPPKLGSHNDQASYWQSSLAEGATSGWGGRMGDLFAAGNGASTFTCVGLSGNAVFLSGKVTSQYQITANGSIPISSITSKQLGNSAACSSALQDILTQPYSHVLEDEYSKIARRSIESDAQVTSALETVSLGTQFSTTQFSNQLKMVARLIGARAALGAKRQVFMVSLGGFDNHADLKRFHPGLLSMLADGLAAFYKATVELGLADKITAFTGSDFGRTLTSNSSGSDHGWGSTHFVLGGALQGKNYIGVSPTWANGGPDDIGQGRLIPTTAVDQLAFTLADWFGVSATDQLTVVPNIVNFSSPKLQLFK